ncbi:hypothetical protein GIB67_026720 [Kingdonia uniflora]|uniref:Late embryogenesis abundant protein n=1 Tax=Kingdonia uniflora TaxID=39325 RepID=A0A7J7MHM2_9MAGN|nr:hypothetical protein GIB67_026720 [Kingdonia uniflora]
MKRNADSENEAEGRSNSEQILKGFPMERSPYLKYTDLEDYKRQAYGTEGHVEPTPERGGGATDIPTPSGNGLTRGIDTANSKTTK